MEGLLLPPLGFLLAMPKLGVMDPPFEDIDLASMGPGLFLKASSHQFKGSGDGAVNMKPIINV